MGFLLFFSLLAWAEPTPQWVRQGSERYLTLTDWQALTGFKPLLGKNGRILLERRGAPPVILLLDAPYALQAARFLALPHAPHQRPRDGAILLSAASAERIFLPLLPASERKVLERTLLPPALLAPLAPVAPVAPMAPPAASLGRPAGVGAGAGAGAGAGPGQGLGAVGIPGGFAGGIPGSLSAPPVMSAIPCQKGRQVRRIFLDPGHGGDDAGTTHERVTEKEVVLKFARLAADELRRHGFEVSFSRTRDVFLPLDVRTKLAEKWQADLFVSLHVNSSPDKSAHGTETYILSQDATDAEARKLALLENSIASAPKAMASESAVQDILWDMEQTAYLQDSAYLASYLQGSIVQNAHDLLLKKRVSGDWKNRGVRQAPFYVLSRAAMPAVLVELGYLSNARDRRLLSEKFFQESLAKALAEGVKTYRDACRAPQ